jgi:ATP-dependent Lhr-like helicase
MQHEEDWHLLPRPLQEWLALQRDHSSLPDSSHLLTETFEHDKQQFLMLYSFAGRNSNQMLGMLLTSKMEEIGLLPLGFVANDYVIALWGLAQVADPAALLVQSLAQENYEHWVENTQMSKRSFRDVALISGLVERGYPGGRKTGRQVTISTDLIYDVLRKYEADHILLKATKHDVMSRLADIARLRQDFAGMKVRNNSLPRISPLAVPLVLDIIGSEQIKGKGQVALLTAESRERIGDALLKEATREFL